MSEAAPSRWRQFGEGVAVLGIILSLVFVGIQIRQSAVVASAQSVQDLAAMSQDFLLTLGTDEETIRIFQVTYFREDSISPLDQLRASCIMIAFVRRAEAAFVHVQRGLLPESALGAYGMDQILSRFRNSRFRAFWSTVRATMDPGFVEYVEQRSGYQADGGGP